MKTIKRLLSVVLVLAMTLGCLSVFAEDAEAVSDTAPAAGELNLDSIKDEMALLKAVGIVGANEELAANARVSRGQFAILAARIFGSSMQAEPKQYFADVFENMDCFESVATLYEMGLISMNDSRTFEPNRNIEYNEACKILVGLLGFGEVAEMTGGYPYGYMRLAVKCGILNNASENDATYENIIRLVYNALNTVEFEVVSVSLRDNELSQQREQVDSTPLSVYHNVYRIEDTVNRTVIGSVINNEYCADDEVVIGGKLFKKDATDYDALLGLTVTAYYKYIQGGDRTIICSFPGEFEEVVVMSEDFIDYSNGTLKYYDEKGREKKVVINKTAPVIKNFDVLDSGFETAYDIEYGKITVRTQEGKVDKQTVTIMDCETFIVDYTDTTLKQVYGKYNFDIDPLTGVKTKDVLELNEEQLRNVEIINAVDGASEVFARIRPGNVLSVYRNKAKDVVKVYIGASHKEGKVESIKNNTDTLVIEGLEYDINPQVKAELNARIGMTGIFFMDMFGKVSYYIPGADAWRVGYLYAADVEDEGFSKYLRVLIFDTDENHNEYRTKKSVIIDGVAEKNADNMLAKLVASGDMSTYKQLIRFKVNDDGIITNIDTALKNRALLEDEPGSLFNSVPYTGSETLYVTNGSFFTPAPLMDRNTLVFVVPNESDNDFDKSKFAIRDKSFFTAQSGNHISAYETNPDYPYAAYVVARKVSVETVDVDKTVMFMVDEILKVANEDGDIITQINGYSRFAASTIYIDRTITMSNITSFNTDMLAKGDVIRPALDVDNYVQDCHIVVDYDKATFNTTSNHIYTNANNGTKSYIYKAASSVPQYNMLYAYVSDKYVNLDTSYTDNVAVIPNDVLYLGYTNKDAKDEKWEIRTDKFIIYDSVLDEVYIGTSQDIISFKGTDKGSMILLWKSWGVGAMQIIYR